MASAYMHYILSLENLKAARYQQKLEASHPKADAVDRAPKERAQDGSSNGPENTSTVIRSIFCQESWA
jgi:hypothetical protein